MIKRIIIGISLIIVDFALYIILGLILLNYEDFYDESEGQYWSLTSMTTVEKIAYISYYLLIAINILIIIYFIYRMIKKYIIKK